MLLQSRYRLIEQLGAGGMAVVWRGFDEVLGRQVAIKVLGPELASDPVFVKRLRQEAQAAARLSHPNITSVHDYGESIAEDGTVKPFVVMELLEGQTLRSLLTEGRRLPWRRAVAIAAEVASAMAAAHASGIVHRDITSSNIMLAPTGAKVMDFGISALIGEREPANHASLMGTPAYVAPERLKAGEVTPAVDVYALGVLLYRSLSGALPWPAESTTDLLDAHQWLSPSPLPPLTGLPPKVTQLCYRCLAKDPADRPSSAEVALTLAKIARVPVAVPPFAGAEPTEVSVARRKTTVLPWWTRQGINPVLAAAAVPATGRALPHLVKTVAMGRRGRVLLGTTAVATAFIVYFALAVVGPDSASNQASAANCQVTYRQTGDTGSRFDASVTVHNNGPGPLQQWQLEFGWPGDQRVVAAQDGTWNQQGQQLTIRPQPEQAALPAGASHRFTLSGEYESLNAMPARFALAGTPCEAMVLGPSTAPAQAQPVQLPAQPERGGGGKGDDGGGNKGKGKGGDDDDDDDDDNKGKGGD